MEAEYGGMFINASIALTIKETLVTPKALSK
jgi:hypothetical protein